MKGVKKISVVIIAILFIIFLNKTEKVYAINDSEIPIVTNVKATQNDNGEIELTWDEVKYDGDLQYDVVYYREGESISNNWSLGTTQNKITLQCTPTIKWCFNVKVSVYNADEKITKSGEWSETVVVTPSTGTIKNIRQTSASQTTATVCWSYIPGAIGYEVRVYNSSSKKYTNTTIENEYTTSTEISGLSIGTTNKVQVRAIYKDSKTDKKIYGEYSKEVNIITKPSKVDNFKATAMSKSTKLTWTKNSSATGYEIYRSTSKDSGYNKIATISNNTTSTYTDNQTYKGVELYYKIIPYKTCDETTYYGEENIITYAYVEPASLSIVSYNDKATLKWTAINYATGYEIYRSTSKNGTYKKIKTISKAGTTSYTDKSVKTKTVYYYKIKPYKTISKKDYYGADSSVVEKTKYAKVTIKSISANSKKKTITIKWNKVSGITGYEIYRSSSKDGTYKKIKTITKASTTSYTDKSISLGNGYYYKIRVYKNNGKKKDYGQYSDKKIQATGTRIQQMNKIKLSPSTSGDKEIDAEYKKIIKKVTNNKMTVYEKVKACYTYLVNNMDHADGYNCKHFAGTFAGMMKVLGIKDVYCPSGQTTSGSGWTAHTWVIMELNGSKYVFDTSIDRHIKDSTGKLQYNRFFKTEKEVSNKYKKEYDRALSFPVLLSKGTGIVASY